MSLLTECTCPYTEAVSPRDPDRFIHLVTGETDAVVRKFLVSEAQVNTVPLIYPCHFNGGFVHWPKPGGRKPNAIRDSEGTQELLVPAAIYVLVKRFTSKEERRRVVACIYDPQRVQAERVGFENHLNYFHTRSRGRIFSQTPLATGAGIGCNCFRGRLSRGSIGIVDFEDFIQSDASINPGNSNIRCIIAQA